MSIVAFDTETRGLDWWDPDHRAFLITWANAKGEFLTTTDDAAGVEKFKQACREAKILVAHNTSFDVHHVRAAIDFDLLELDVELWDTDIMARVVYPMGQEGGPSNYKLKNLAKVFLRDDAADTEDEIKKMAKAIGLSTIKQTGAYYEVWRAYPQKMEAYALNDARITYDLFEKLLARVTADPRASRIMDLENAVMPILIRAECHGVALDPERVRELTKDEKARRAAARDQLDAEGIPTEGEGIEEALIEALQMHGVPLYRRTRTGRLSTAKFALQEFEDDHAVIKTLQEFRGADKLLSTYLGPMESRDVVHTSFRQCEAWTGRMSCIAGGSFVDAPRNLLLHPRGIPIERIREGQFVYSFGDDGVPRARRVLAKTYMGEKKVLTLVWRASGSKSYMGELTATPDHRIRMQDGTYTRLDELQPGDKLAYLGRSMDSDGRAYLRWGAEAKVYEHRHLLPDAEVVHHQNGIPQDNNVENLRATTAAEHSALHGNQHGGKYYPCPYSLEDFAEMVQGGIKRAMKDHGHDFHVWKRWAAECGVEIPDRRRRVARNNHEVVMVVSKGETRKVWDLTIEDTPNFVVNEIGVHNCARPNVQNLPRGELRSVLVPRPGYSFVVADYDAIEMRLLAYYTGSEDYRYRVENEDPHAWMASQIWGDHPDTYAKGGPRDEDRSKAKNGLFAVCYGAGGGRLSDMFKLDPGPPLKADSWEVRNGYKQVGEPSHAAGKKLARDIKDAIPGFKGLNARIRRKIETVGHVNTIMGRKQPVSRDKAYVGLNALIQGSAADIMKQGLINVDEALQGYDATVLLVVHDEVVVEVRTEQAERAEALIVDAMESAHELDPPLKVTSAIVSTNYADAK